MIIYDHNQVVVMSKQKQKEDEPSNQEESQESWQ